MGLAFLPWERLPAYVLGPLIYAINIACLCSQQPFAWTGAFFCVSSLVFATWLVVQRYRTGKEPLAVEKKRDGEA